MDWDDYGYDDYGSYDDTVVMDPYNVTPDDNLDDNEEPVGIDESQLFGGDLDGDGIDDFTGGSVDYSSYTSDAIINALNQNSQAGWQQVNETTFRNPATGQTYDSNTGKISTPRANNSASSTNPRSTASGGSSGSGGSFGSGGSSGSGSGSNSALDGIVKTLSSLLSNFNKISTAVAGPQTTSTRTAANTSATQIDLPKLAIAAGCVIGAIFLIKKATK